MLDWALSCGKDPILTITIEDFLIVLWLAWWLLKIFSCFMTCAITVEDFLVAFNYDLYDHCWRFFFSCFMTCTITVEDSFSCFTTCMITVEEFLVVLWLVQSLLESFWLFCDLSDHCWRLLGCLIMTWLYNRCWRVFGCLMTCTSLLKLFWLLYDRYNHCWRALVVS